MGRTKSGDEILAGCYFVCSFWPVAGRDQVKNLKSIDWNFFVICLCMTIFGLLMVYDASSASALKTFGNKFFFLRDQIVWAILGIGVALTASQFDYRRLYSISPFILIGAICFLVAVFIPGVGVHALGANRWINFHFFVLQPSELTKLAYIIYLSAWFSTKDKSKFLSFITLTGLVVGLIMLQPDMGTAIILSCVGLTMYFLSGEKVWHVIALGLSIIPVAILFAIKSPYRMRRITTFLDPENDPLGSSYHIRQALIALGSGGLMGLGLGNSRQKYSYLPEAMTDSIFAIIGEELGLIGVLLMILALMTLMSRGLKIAINASDKFGQLLVVGIISWLIIQSVINLGAMVALLPLTGVPLPFISYGGSSLVTQWLGVGIILSVSKNLNLNK